MDKFEEALQQHKDNLTKNLLGFGEWHRLNRMHKDIDSNAADYEYYFNAGQQSQQAKVEELQKRLDRALKETQYALQYVEEDMRGNHEFLQMAMIRTFKAIEQVLKGEGQ